LKPPSFAHIDVVNIDDWGRRFRFVIRSGEEDVMIDRAFLSRLLLTTAVPLAITLMGAGLASAATVIVTGANGANGVGGPGLPGGEASAIAVTTDPSNTATATGGVGGTGDIGFDGGAGGMGSVTATTTQPDAMGNGSATATGQGGAG
jgi:hypothetical protein